MTLHAYCPKRGCGARLVASTNGHGGVVVACPACDRNAVGLCRDCPATLERPRALRCSRCKVRHAKASQRRRYQDNRETVLKQQKKRNQRPEVREWRRNYMKSYNAEYYGDEMGRRAHVAATKRWRETPKGRQSTRAANARWNKKHARRSQAA